MDSTAFLSGDEMEIQKFKGAPPRRVLRKGSRKKTPEKKCNGSKVVTRPPRKVHIGGIGYGPSITTEGSSAGKKALSSKNSNARAEKSNGKTLIPKKPRIVKTEMTKGNKVKQLQERMRALAMELMNRAKVCPKKHKLKHFTGDVHGYSCNICLEECDEVYGCRACDWDACEECLKKNSRDQQNKESSSTDSNKKSSGSKNGQEEEDDDDVCWDFRKGKCRKGSRCKWKHIDEESEDQLIDSGDSREVVPTSSWWSSRNSFNPYPTVHNPYRGAPAPINPALLRNSGLPSDFSYDFPDDFSGDLSCDNEIFEGLHLRPVVHKLMGQGSVEALMFNSSHLAGPKMDENMCWNFLEGRCRAGESCKWLHEFPEDAVEEFRKKEVCCPVCAQKFIDHEGLEQHQEAKLHYPPEILKKLKEVMKKKEKSNEPRNENAKDADWGSWEKHGTGIGSKMLKKWGFQDRLGKTKVGPINPVHVDIRRKNTGLGFAGSKKRKKIRDDPELHQIIVNGNKKMKCAPKLEPIKKPSGPKFSQVPLDYSKIQSVSPSPQLSEAATQVIKKVPLRKRINNSKKRKKKGGIGKPPSVKKQKPAKGEEGYDICWSFKKGTCRKGKKCKWKHS